MVREEIKGDLVVHLRRISACLSSIPPRRRVALLPSSEWLFRRGRLQTRLPSSIISHLLCNSCKWYLVICTSLHKMRRPNNNPIRVTKRKREGERDTTERFNHLEYKRHGTHTSLTRGYSLLLLLTRGPSQNKELRDAMVLPSTPPSTSR